MQNLYFKNISDFHKYFEVEKPENPLFSIIHKETEIEESCVTTSKKLSEFISLKTDFYTISFKNIVSGDIAYGRTKYDCKNGTLLFTSPQQKLVFKDVIVSDESFAINIHEEYLRGSELLSKIKLYNFFKYQVNEALHLTPREEMVIRNIFMNILNEYHNNQDYYSKDLIISQLDTLLKYCDRFYNRQFIDRRELSGELIEKLNLQLFEYSEKGLLREDGIPSIQFLAKKLNVSSRYLGDTLKKETGKSTLEHIQLFIINIAKSKLLEPHITVSEVAFDLGFEYPQYFSRIFKKKVGISPSAYRVSFGMN